jgi:hypothetical protein
LRFVLATIVVKIATDRITSPVTEIETGRNQRFRQTLFQIFRFSEFQPFFFVVSLAQHRLFHAFQSTSKLKLLAGEPIPDKDTALFASGLRRIPFLRRVCLNTKS